MKSLLGLRLAKVDRRNFKSSGEIEWNFLFLLEVSVVCTWKRLRLNSKKAQGNYQERSKDTTGDNPTRNEASSVLRLRLHCCSNGMSSKLKLGQVNKVRYKHVFPHNFSEYFPDLHKSSFSPSNTWLHLYITRTFHYPINTWFI